MKSLSKLTATVLLLLPLSTTMAYAESTSQTSAASATTQNHFVTVYQKNQQTEATLLQQAQPVQSANSTQYASFVNSVSAQVATLYASEQSLAQLGFTWGSAIKGTKNQNVTLQEEKLKTELKAEVHVADKSPDKTPAQKQTVKKLRVKIAQLNKAFTLLNANIHAVAKVDVNTDAKYFSQNVTSLQSTILGLQEDEIRVTKTWISSGQTSTSGTTNTSTNSTGTGTVASNTTNTSSSN